MSNVTYISDNVSLIDFFNLFLKKYNRKEFMYVGEETRDKEFLLCDYYGDYHNVLQNLQEGLILEFGVHMGKSINILAKKMNGKKLYGFDSFEGIPEAWVEHDKNGNPLGEIYGKNAMSLNGCMPKVEDNVTLIKGWFNETLDNFLKENKEPIKFIHIDCDIYSSTVDIFNSCKEQIVDGTIIIFDELFQGKDIYNEFKAFYEFIKENNLGFEVICYSKYSSNQWMVKIIK